ALALLSGDPAVAECRAFWGDMKISPQISPDDSSMKNSSGISRSAGIACESEWAGANAGATGGEGDVPVADRIRRKRSCLHAEPGRIRMTWHMTSMRRSC